MSGLDFLWIGLGVLAITVSLVLIAAVVVQVCVIRKVSRGAKAVQGHVEQVFEEVSKPSMPTIPTLPFVPVNAWFSNPRGSN